MHNDIWGCLLYTSDDGKRQWWYVNFANENKNYVSILISDGEIDVVEHFDNNANTDVYKRQV